MDKILFVDTTNESDSHWSRRKWKLPFNVFLLAVVDAAVPVNTTCFGIQSMVLLWAKHVFIDTILIVPLNINPFFDEMWICAERETTEFKSGNNAYIYSCSRVFVVSHHITTSKPTTTTTICLFRLHHPSRSFCIYPHAVYSVFKNSDITFICAHSILPSLNVFKEIVSKVNIKVCHYVVIACLFRFYYSIITSATYANVHLFRVTDLNIENVHTFQYFIVIILLTQVNSHIFVSKQSMGIWWTGKFCV